MTRKGKFRAILPNPDGQPLPTHLVDALVSIQGACSSELNIRRQLSGITLLVPGPGHIRIIEPSPADPFTTASTRIEAVATFDPDHLAGRRVKVSGVVTLLLPGEGFFLQDDSGGLRVQTPQTNEFQVDDQVEALGFPALGDFSPHLEESSARRLASGTRPPPRTVRADQVLLAGSHDGLLVQMEARLVQNVPRSASPQLVLRDGPIVFAARWEVPLGSKHAPVLQSGSLVRLTGVCSIQGSEGHEPKAFSLLLGKATDVTLIESPAWWNLRHTLMLAGGLTVLVGAALAWVILLRRQVRAQTEVIRQELAEREQIHKQLVEASRQAGMAEVATSVLHNVGNVLNSVNVAATLVADQVRKSKTKSLSKIVGLLGEHEADLGEFITRDLRGQQVPAYLGRLAEHLGREQTTLLQEIESLRKNIEHIKEIVAMQQAYARVSGVIE
jgi:hypothetical protein